MMKSLLFYEGIMKTRITLLVYALFDCAIMAQENYQVPIRPGNETIAPGKFKPTWESLSQYQEPEWYRNAKFGIWAY
jgi:alpha-L-fucosidase